jgi:hypothetical protein
MLLTPTEGMSGAISPLLAFGLAANLQRHFSTSGTQPCWRLFVPLEQEGLKLSNRVVTERLQKIQATARLAKARGN